ncbi:MAG: hypothetical protein NZQ09_02940 [Chloroflexus sp.]|nr:hypothetical protein [Chloroflexus sp.]
MGLIVRYLQRLSPWLGTSWRGALELIYVFLAILLPNPLYARPAPMMGSPSDYPHLHNLI